MYYKSVELRLLRKNNNNNNNYTILPTGESVTPVSKICKCFQTIKTNQWLLCDN